VSSYDDAYQAGVDAFDRAYFERFGRYPAESPLADVDPSLLRRRQAVQRLAEQGATEGERAAARAALGRLEASHAEQDAMQRGGNWIDG